MADFQPVFDALRDILAAHAVGLDITTDDEADFSVYTRYRMKNGQPLWFGAVHIKKRYVAYHLMPIYLQPALLEPLSAALRKRMQGKSCFNFTRVDETLFTELDTLTAAGRDSYRAEGYIDSAV